jgi:hypothetical protein
VSSATTTAAVMPVSTSARIHGRLGVSDDAMPEVYPPRVNPG